MDRQREPRSGKTSTITVGAAPVRATGIPLRVLAVGSAAVAGDLGGELGLDKAGGQHRPVPHGPGPGRRAGWIHRSPGGAAFRCLIGVDLG